MEGATVVDSVLASENMQKRILEYSSDGDSDESKKSRMDNVDVKGSPDIVGKTVNIFF